MSQYIACLNTVWFGTKNSAEEDEDADAADASSSDGVDGNSENDANEDDPFTSVDLLQVYTSSIEAKVAVANAMVATYADSTHTNRLYMPDTCYITITAEHYAILPPLVKKLFTFFEREQIELAYTKAKNENRIPPKTPIPLTDVYGIPDVYLKDNYFIVTGMFNKYNTFKILTNYPDCEYKYMKFTYEIHQTTDVTD